MAEERGEVAALTEVGVENIPYSDWWMGYLLPGIRYDADSRKIAWALVWRNASVAHYFAPYPGNRASPIFVILS